MYWRPGRRRALGIGLRPSAKPRFWFFFKAVRQGNQAIAGDKAGLVLPIAGVAVEPGAVRVLGGDKLGGEIVLPVVGLSFRILHPFLAIDVERFRPGVIVVIYR